VPICTGLFTTSSSFMASPSIPATALPFAQSDALAGALAGLRGDVPRMWLDALSRQDATSAIIARHPVQDPKQTLRPHPKTSREHGFGDGLANVDQRREFVRHVTVYGYFPNFRRQHQLDTVAHGPKGRPGLGSFGLRPVLPDFSKVVHSTSSQLGHSTPPSPSQVTHSFSWMPGDSSQSRQGTAPSSLHRGHSAIGHHRLPFAPRGQLFPLAVVLSSALDFCNVLPVPAQPVAYQVSQTEQLPTL